ncbi:hypothetical protein [Streptomyces sp. NPDC056291]|uniref:hypothetical protein n=1 Tax=Streptomyces sp. NPDC056291 TaxID=3345772 RepID=UPI0035D5A26A
MLDHFHRVGEVFDLSVLEGCGERIVPGPRSARRSSMSLQPSDHGACGQEFEI